jgi:anaerobic ribonucleoside-triphosphate reductase
MKDIKTLAKESNMELNKEEAVSCPHCGSHNAYGISRIVGYYSPIENWNGGKQTEFEARQRGNYKL